MNSHSSHLHPASKLFGDFANKVARAAGRPSAFVLAAIQVKLDELIRVSKVKNMFVGIEHLTEDEIEELREKCEARAKERRGTVSPRRQARAARS